MSEIVTLETEIVASVTAATELEAVELATQGPVGPPGPIGPAGDAPSIIASTTLSGHRVLAANGDGQAIYAQHSDASALAVQGLSTQSGTVGDELVILKSGATPWPAGGLTAGSPLFLTTDGQINHIPPTSGWIRQIAVAIDSDTISIDIGPAYWAGA